MMETLEMLRDKYLGLSQGYNDPKENERCRRIAEKVSEALYLLKKAATARLMTPADFEGNPNVDADGFLPCWCETTQSYDEVTCARLGFKEPTTFSGWTTIDRDDLADKEEQEKGLRYWTKRPTRQQMEATPWE